MKRVLVLSFIAVLGAVSIGSAASENAKDRRTVNVQGQGKIHAVPDIARIFAEVRDEGPSLETISANVRKTMGKVMDTLKAQGIADKDLQTQMYEVRPKYEQDRRGNSKPVGFYVTNRAEAKVKDISKLGKILTAVVNAGATGVEGPQFDFDDPKSLERKALANAMEDAKAKAKILVEAAGATLGEVFTIDQSGGIAWPMYRPMRAKMQMMAMSAEASEPIEAGQQDITSNIQVTFLIR